MSWGALSLSDQVGAVIGLTLTLGVFSYWLRDNALFRLAIHIFIGATTAYVTAVLWYNVLWPRLLLPIMSGDLPDALLAIVPLILSILLIFKAFPRLSAAGSPALALLVGVGAAVAIGGAIIGTIVPQTLSTINIFGTQVAQPGSDTTWISGINGGILFIGTLATLAYFHFGARWKINQPPARAAWIDDIAWVGKLFITITLGAVLAAVYASASAALVERLSFLVRFVQSLSGS